MVGGRPVLLTVDQRTVVVSVNFNYDTKQTIDYIFYMIVVILDALEKFVHDDEYIS